MNTQLHTQLPLFKEERLELDGRLWSGSFNAKESSLHQLAPYVGKLKSGMVQVLIEKYSSPDDVVLDPFCGSGVVPLECVLMGRHTIGNDLSPYAEVITRGKLSAPSTKQEALSQALGIIDEIESRASSVNVQRAPAWVQEFFHPQTFKEVLAAFDVLKERQNFFLMACLLGILHHVRPGFLSYPASHLTPYLRPKMYPQDKFPKMYSYRDLRSRLLSKVERAYRRLHFTHLQEQISWKVISENTMHLSLADDSVDAVITSPPYFGALDYARDNRLRLWFLGYPDWKELDRSLTANEHVYISQMSQCLRELRRVLKEDGYCVMVLGDVERNGVKRHTANIISELAREVTDDQLATKSIYSDEIPDMRRSRRRTKTTKYERIVVMQKVNCLKRDSSEMFA
ncbi:MAG: DNA methyltransferase [Chloroflexota bacterium]